MRLDAGWQKPGLVMRPTWTGPDTDLPRMGKTCSFTGTKAEPMRRSNFERERDRAPRLSDY